MLLKAKPVKAVRAAVHVEDHRYFLLGVKWGAG